MAKKRVKLDDDVVVFVVRPGFATSQLEIHLARNMLDHYLFQINGVPIAEVYVMRPGHMSEAEFKEFDGWIVDKHEGEAYAYGWCGHTIKAFEKCN